MIDVKGRVRTGAAFVSLLLAAVLSSGSCSVDRPSPGSDLPPLPDAGAPDVSEDRGVMQPGSVLDGTFVAPTQAGVISDGTATLSGSVHIDDYESRTLRTFERVVVSAQRRFRIDLETMLIPKELNSLLADDVTDTTVAFVDVQIADSCQFAGRMDGILRKVNSKLGLLPEVVVAGDFTATGSSCACATDAAGTEVGPQRDSCARRCFLLASR